MGKTCKRKIKEGKVKMNDEQEYLDGLGSWYGKNHTPILSHAELLVNYRIFERGKDLAYIEARDKLIPEAVKFANMKCGKAFSGANKEKAVWAAKWSRSFHTKMNQLAAKL